MARAAKVETCESSGQSKPSAILARPGFPLPRGNGHLSGIGSRTSRQGAWAGQCLGLEDRVGLGGGRQRLAASSAHWPMRYLAQGTNVCLVEVSEARGSQKPCCNQVGLGADMS